MITIFFFLANVVSGAEKTVGEGVGGWEGGKSFNNPLIAKQLV